MTILRTLTAGVWLALWIASCSATSEVDQAPRWDGPELRTLALPRIVFVGPGPDPFCDRYLADDLHWHMRRALERLGYRVTGAAMPERENSYRPDPWAKASAIQMLTLLPDATQGIVRIRIDRLLSLDSCGSSPDQTLELDATAELFLPGFEEPKWYNSASAFATAFGRSDDLPFHVGADLARTLFSSFPRAAED